MSVKISVRVPAFNYFGIYPEVEFLNHMLILCLIFLRNHILFFTVATPFYIPTNNAQGLPISPHRCQHFLVSGFFFCVVVVVVFVIVFK